MNREENFIQVPLVIRSGASRTQLIGVELPKLHAIFADRFAGRVDPAGEKQLFHIAIAQTEAEI